MSQEHLSSPNGTHEGDTPGERVTLSVPIHLATPTRPIVVREGPKPARPTGRIPRVARILAQAHHFQNLIDTGVVRTQMELAELTKLTTARITQIMNLLVLAPDIQEEILFMPPVTERLAPVTERDLRPPLEDVGVERATGALGCHPVRALASACFSASAICAPGFASIWRTITRSAAIKAWAAGSSCRPPA